MLGLLAGIVWLIVLLVRRKGVKIPAISIGTAVVLIVVGAVISPSSGEGTENTAPIGKAMEKVVTQPKPSPTYNPLRAGKDKLAPTPYGQPVIHHDIEVVVTDVVRGWSGGGPFINLDPDHEWVVVSLQLRNLGAANKTKRYNPLEFRLTGARGVIYDKWLTPDSASPLGSGEFFGGATVTGSIIQQVHTQDTDLVLIYSPPFQGSRYLSLEPTK